ncbi:MAG: EAL domain-containing protein [Gammaproteobacteria bacterium]|nr:EAL domain-containing protein [Gammaproteobacteria bacterium]MCP5195296.1 EAL domain-containing protein [Gammaproteobacteria bacterium]
MNQAKGQDSQRLRLVNHLTLIEDLWQKLYYVKWNPKSFAMLVRLAQDMVKNAQGRDDERLLKLVTQLEHHVRGCATVNEIPPESERQRLMVLIDALRFILATDNSSANDEPRTRPLLAVQPEIFLIIPDTEKPSLMTKLEDFGYRVRHISNLIEAEERLHERMPGAVIIDVDFPEGSEAVLEMVTNLRAQIGFRSPVLFLAERNDMAARLEAVRAGGAAYFNKPLDNDELISLLRELLLPQTSEGHYRVLIVNDRPTEAWEMAGALEEQGITPRVLIQPLQVLQDIHRFRPDLLLIDLDIKEVSGPELAQVIAQHRDCDILPLVLMCFPADVAHYLMNLEVPGASLLTKPVPISYLCWEVKQRLRRARAMRVKLSLLSDNDVVSGLYNRRRFMVLLERGLEAMGLRLQTLVVIFIMLDNLRTIRESAGVATADEVVGQAASRLRQVLTAEQPAARFSEAAFAIMAPNLFGEAPLHLSRRIRDALETGFYKVGDQALLLRTSIGIALTNDRSQDHLMLMQRADSACGLAREAKGERIYLQQNIPLGQRDHEASSRARMLDQVREMIDREWLWLVFQPIASMHGDTDERYEVLLRLRDNQGQELVPGSVFGVVHNHELGLALDRWVIAQTLEILQQRQAATTLFIKVLPVTLQDKTLGVWLRETLERTGVEAQRIVFEVAESTAERSLRDMFTFLSGIKLLGCGFCLDRFGRGADSLNLLKNLGADYVKLDMYFVNHLAKDAKKQTQLKELVGHLESLGAATIVGGVEDVQAMPILWSLGVDLIQGFFLQHPYREMSYDFANAGF